MTRLPYRVAIHCGTEVDNYLASEGALAQAVNRNTILVGSAAFGLSRSDQRILLLHELAHLHQLANPGNDPVRPLEDEAWEAAYAWARGAVYRVRGRARRPLNAFAIVQGGAKGHPSAPSWYGSNPVEPIGNNSNIVVKERIVQQSMSLESIMDEIIARKEKQVVIVSHGWPEGLAIPLAAGSGLGARMENVVRLAADRSFKRGDVNTPVIADKDVAASVLTEDRVKGLRAKMNLVRGLNLDHVAFRACDMGRSPDITMNAFRNLFGAKSVSAPKLLDSYGRFPTEIGGKINDWVKIRRKQNYRVWIDRGVAFGIRAAKTIAQDAYRIVCRAPDRGTFIDWVKAHISDRQGSDKIVVYHGMEDRGVADQTAQMTYFVRDADYISNIVFYQG